MGAKFYMCLLLVIMVTAPVYCARLRSAQDAGKSSLFLYGRLFRDPIYQGCCVSCSSGCQYTYPCSASMCVTPEGQGGCPDGQQCCCSQAVGGR